MRMSKVMKYTRGFGDKRMNVELNGEPFEMIECFKN